MTSCCSWNDCLESSRDVWILHPRLHVCSWTSDTNKGREEDAKQRQQQKGKETIPSTDRMVPEEPIKEEEEVEDEPIHFVYDPTARSCVRGAMPSLARKKLFIRRSGMPTISNPHWSPFLWIMTILAVRIIRIRPLLLLLPM